MCMMIKDLEDCDCMRVGRLWDTLIYVVPDLSMAQVPTGPTGGSNTTVLQDGVEVGGSTCAGLFRRKRLHGGEDEGQTVGHVLVWGAGQSWCVTCR